MKKWCLLCISLLFVLLSFSSAQQEILLPPPDPAQPIIFNEPPFCQVGAPPISPQWQARRSWYYTGMVAGNFDGDAYQEVAFDYGASGIWVYDPNAGTQWNKISTDDPQWMIAVGIGDPATDELVIKQSDDVLYWWGYSGYPGTLTGITSSVIDFAYDAGNIGDGDTGHEFVGDFDGIGLFIFDYTGTGIYGGFDAHYVHEPPASYGQGMPIDLDGNGDYELIHYFPEGLQYWNYSSGYPATWSSPLTTNFCEMVDCLAMDVDGAAGDEFIADSTVGLWKYEHGAPGTWTRISYNPILEAWPCAYDTIGNNYEAVFTFSPDIGLWEWNDGTDWYRINWTLPTFALGANVASSANGGNGGEEFIGDFGSIGVWIQYLWRGAWTRLNWNNPDNFIVANLDTDAELEVVFDFGSLGVWTWDQATNAWSRINWGSPESN